MLFRRISQKLRFRGDMTGKGSIFHPRFLRHLTDHGDALRQGEGLLLPFQFHLHDRHVLPEGVNVDLEGKALVGQAVAALADGKGGRVTGGQQLCFLCKPNPNITAYTVRPKAVSLAWRAYTF